ncbi:MAG: hypothetical protein IJ588_08825 [Prevotella sp.]|nr:hypothetical protein [Prevotella sp.]
MGKKGYPDGIIRYPISVVDHTPSGNGAGGSVIVRPGPNTVGTNEIEDGSVQLQDLSPEAREAMENQFATEDDVRHLLGLPDN